MDFSASLPPSSTSASLPSSPFHPSPFSPPSSFVLVVDLTVQSNGHVDVSVFAVSTIPQAPTLHPFSPFFRYSHQLHRPLPASSSVPFFSPLKRRMLEEEAEEKKAHHPHAHSHVLDLNGGSPLPLTLYPYTFHTYGEPGRADEEKAPHSPLPHAPRSRSSSCPEHVIAFPMPASTDTTVALSPASLSYLTHTNPPTPLLASHDPEADLRLHRRLHNQLVSRMLQHAQRDDAEWAAMDVQRAALQERIDRQVRGAVAPAGRGMPRRPVVERELRLSLWVDDLVDCEPSGPGTFACPVCLESLPSHCGVSLACSHMVCGACLSSYLATHIAEGQVVIRCPCYTTRPCPTVLSNAFIAAFTPAVQYSHWLRLCRQKKNSAYRACPRCDHQQKGNRLRPGMRCDKCQFEYCYAHANAHPPSVSCRAYMKTQKNSVRASLKCIAQTTVQCPSCGVAVELSSGCNHVTCSQCECEFCFLCGGRYLCGLHFWDYNFLTGCPGMQHAGGVAGERRTLRLRLYRLLIGYPLTLILVPLLLLLAVAAFVLVEVLWLALFVALLPAVLLLFCCCSSWVERWEWRTTERVNFWLFLGPRVLRRLCSCC